MDLSYQGIGFLSPREFCAGDVLRVDLSRQAGKPCIVVMIILACRAVLPGVFRVGARFEFDD